jgi:hypothetical protein
VTHDDVEKLSADPAARAEQIAARSRPDPDAPRVSRRTEALLAGIERRTAASYARLEELQYRLSRAADELEHQIGINGAERAATTH